MANFTEKAIKESFIKLLNQRPVSKITVKDIVEDCGINRNSFYYHYQDLPSLIEQIVTENAEEIIEKYPTIDSIEQGLDVALRFAMENKTAVLHLYNSVSRDIYEHYLMRVLDYVITKCIDTLISGQDVSGEDRKLIIKLYKCECFGIIMEWTGGGMKEDILRDFHRLCQLRSGMAEELARRCVASPDSDRQTSCRD